MSQFILTALTAAINEVEQREKGAPKLRELQIEQSNLGRQIVDKLETLAGMNQQTRHHITLAAQAMLSGDLSLEAVNQPNIEKELDSLRQKKRVLEKAIQLQRETLGKKKAWEILKRLCRIEY